MPGEYPGLRVSPTHEGVAALDLLAWHDKDVRDGRGGWGGDRVLHLHGLQDDQRLTRLDIVACSNANGKDRAGHRGDDGRHGAVLALGLAHRRINGRWRGERRLERAPVQVEQGATPVGRPTYPTERGRIRVGQALVPTKADGHAPRAVESEARSHARGGPVGR